MVRSIDCAPQLESAQSEYCLTQDQLVFLNYWRAKIHLGRLPGRHDIDPLEFPKLLPRIGLVDVLRNDQAVDHPLVYRARLLGTEITAHFGRDVTGKVGQQLYDNAYLRQIEAIYGQVVADGVPLLCLCQVPIKDGGGMTTYSRLIAPLAANGEDVDMLLSLFTFPPSEPATRRQLACAKSVWQVAAYRESDVSIPSMTAG
jgi:hypothetical protein|tara:strand:+ start:3190 stop:3792 length:603 start_codon:yes stop_codon:yes gene_type:complete